jgi:hypothetical protein
MVSPKQARQYLAQLQEYNADPLTLLMELDKVRTMCLDGYQTEKATAKGEVVNVTEVDPRTVVAAVKETRELIKFLMVAAGDAGEDQRDYVFNLNVISAPPAPKQIDQDTLEL